MNKECGKCHGKGGRERQKPKGTYSGFFGNSREWVKCDVCHGSGINPDYRSKSCRNCWNTIEYSARTDSSKVPDLCPSCREKARNDKNREREARQHQPRREDRPRFEQRPRQDDKWQEKSCPGLKGEYGCSSHSTIRYRTDWSRIPDLCPTCIAKIKAKKTERDAKWREKPCAGGCGSTIKYNVDWEHPPNYCPACKQARSQRNQTDSRGQDIFRSQLMPAGWESSLVGNAQIHKEHSTMTFRGKGTNGATYRVSWDGYGNAHWTDEGLPEGHPERHRDPRR